jgi:hypothetical protein
VRKIKDAKVVNIKAIKDEARLAAGPSPNKPKTKIMNQTFFFAQYNPVIHLPGLYATKI